MTSKKWVPLSIIVYFMLFFVSQNVLHAEDYSQDLPEISEKLDTKIDLNLSFINDSGKRKTLKEMFNGQPVLLITLNYFRCTTMCTYQFLNLADALKKINLPLGNGFTVASISFDTTDDVVRAKQTRDMWLKQLDVLDAPWRFYTSTDVNEINKLTKSLNFFYEADDENNFSHTGGLFFLSEDGTLKRYLYGIVYEPRDIKYALLDTSNGKVGSLFDKIARKFLRYNASRGRYE